MSGKPKDEAPDEAQTGFVKVPAVPVAPPDLSTAKPWGGQPDQPAPDQPKPKAEQPKTDRT